jgi:hypothetical protein
MSPEVDHTPAGGSPPRPVPKVGDLVEVAKLPDQCDPRLKMGQRGRVVAVNNAMFSVRFSWGVARLNKVQIDLK